MPKKTNTKITKMDNVAFLQKTAKMIEADKIAQLKAKGIEVRDNEAQSEFAKRIPEITKENLATLFDEIFEYEAVRNEFLSAVNKIGMTFIANKPLWRNVLAEFVKGTLTFGDTVEEIFVDMAKAKDFNQATAETEVFKREYVATHSAYHRINRRHFYKITLSEEIWREAFTDSAGLGNFVATYYRAMQQADEYDTFLLFKKLLSLGVDENVTRVQVVQTPQDETTAKAMLRTIRTIVGEWKFLSDKFNQAKVMTHSPADDIIVITTPQVSAVLDVDAYASLFHLDKAEIEQRLVLVDELPLVRDDVKIEALIVDRDYLNIWDVLYKTNEIYNPEGLYYNQFLHHWQILSVSPFANIVALVSEVPPATGDSVEGEDVTTLAGETIDVASEAGTPIKPIAKQAEKTTAEIRKESGKVLEVKEDKQLISEDADLNNIK